jgi:hypothetical protein
VGACDDWRNLPVSVRLWTTVVVLDKVEVRSIVSVKDCVLMTPAGETVVVDVSVTRIARQQI